MPVPSPDRSAARFGDLHDRLQAQFDRFKNLPEAGRTPEGTVMKSAAFVAFLNARKLIEDEVLPALHQLGMEQNSAERRLRAATEDDVAAALADSYIAPPLVAPADLLEFFNRMLDVTQGEDEG